MKCSLQLAHDIECGCGGADFLFQSGYSGFVCARVFASLVKACGKDIYIYILIFVADKARRFNPASILFTEYFMH